MDLGQLQAFDEIVRRGSFSRAAEHLSLSQPSVSSRIARLEEHLGGPLFQRGTRKLDLTELGQRFLPYARQALSVMQAGMQMAELTRSGEQGRLTVAALPTLAQGRFSTALNRFHQMEPHTSVTVHTGHNTQVEEMLTGGFVSLGLLNLPVPPSKMVEHLRFKEPLVLVVHPRHPLRSLNRPTLQDLLQSTEPFLRIDWSWDVRNWQVHWIPVRPGDLEVPPLVALSMLKQHLGAALLPRPWVADDIQHGHLVELVLSDQPLPTWLWGVCGLTGQNLTRVQKRFLTFLQG